MNGDRGGLAGSFW